MGRTPEMYALSALLPACAILCGAASSTTASAAPTTTPNIVYFLIDDLGHGGLELNNPFIKGPEVTRLREQGIYLTRHYVYKFCSPTRGSLLSGRYPYRLGNTRSNFIPWSRPDGLNLGFNLLSDRLKDLGYSTHHVGKWHLGFHNQSFIPTSRGFDSFFGYLGGMQDHFTQELGTMIRCRSVVDLTRNATPALGENGTYSGWIYNQAAVQVVATAPEPFFLNYWHQNTHAPFEVPDQYRAEFNFTLPGLNIFNGMVAVVDEAVGNVTAALQARGVWENTLIIYTHDNGAPLGGGGSNFPFRGGKNSNFEGGVRVPAIISGGWLAESLRNTTNDHLFHVSDWLPTILGALGHKQPLTDSVSAVIPYDGIQQWDQVTTGLGVHRNEIILDHCLAGFSRSGTGCNHFGAKTSVGAIISGDAGEWKLVKGPNGGEWTNFTNGTNSNSFNMVACANNCLFNLTADPSEHHDLSQQYPDILKELLERFENLTTSYHPPQFNPPADDSGCCAAAVSAGNFLVPWTDK